MTQCKSILVADDNHDVRESVISVLRRDGYEAAGAANGEEALKALEHLTHPVLILLDMMMPIMNGWQFLEAMRRNGKSDETVIVTMSAVNSRQSPDEHDRFRAVASLQKPITLQSLRAMTRKYCEAPAQPVRGRGTSMTGQHSAER